MIKVGPDDYVLGLWSVGGCPDGTDWLAGVVRSNAGGDWRLAFRYRYTNDEASWYEGSFPAAMTEEEIVDAMNGTAGVVIEEFGGEATHMPVRGDIDALIKALEDTPNLRYLITEKDAPS